MKFTKKLLGSQNQKGVALMIAIFTVVVVLYLAMEILYETNIEYAVNSQAVHKVKAYYAAKSGYELSLLRIKLFAKVSQQVGDKLPAEQRKMLDLVWSFPFAWPPMIPDEALSIDKESVQGKVSEALLEGNYFTSISDEGSKIDVNDLGSPSKALREVTKKLLSQIFENRIQNDEGWSKNQDEQKIKELLNNIEDWVDPDTLSQNRGEESQLYEDLKLDDGKLPPNRAFRTVEEVRMVAGMTDEYWAMLRDRITVYGTHAINPNYASSDVLKSLDPSMTDEIVGKITSRRQDPELGGPFADANDFWGFVNSQQGARITEEVQKQIPLVFGQVYNFKIKSTGEFANVTREIEAVVFDLNTSALAVANKLQQEAAEKVGQTFTPTDKKNTDTLPKGPPRVVYFIEK
jgi:general secretion pathway protein K